MKKLSLCTVVLVTSMSLLGISEANAGNTYDYVKSCPAKGFNNAGKGTADKWNFYLCECTSYVADKLNERGVKFSNSYKNIPWSNASNWSAAATKAKISQDNAPRVGDVAWFSGGTYGHVAYVEKVLTNGTIDISEYNWSSKYNYGIRNIKKTSVSKFIHF